MGHAAEKVELLSLSTDVKQAFLLCKNLVIRKPKRAEQQVQATTYRSLTKIEMLCIQ